MQSYLQSYLDRLQSYLDRPVREKNAEKSLGDAILHEYRGAPHHHALTSTMPCVAEDAGGGNGARKTRAARRLGWARCAGT